NPPVGRPGFSGVPRRAEGVSGGREMPTGGPAAGLRQMRAPVRSVDTDSTPILIGVPMPEHTLEPPAQAFADATSQPPFLYELGPAGARKALDEVHAGPIAKPDVDDAWITVPADVRDVRVRIVKPVGAP